MKNWLINLKRFFIIFSVCFTVLFMLFSINAIYSILKYKITHFRETILFSLKRPISFSSKIENVNVIGKIKETLKSALS